MVVTEMWLVRHGESVGNVAATRAQREGLDRIPLDIRDADVELSPVGVQQARALGSWLAEHPDSADAFWVSPYIRARETVAIARDGAAGTDQRPARIVVDERLRDRELGILDLLTSAGVQRFHPAETERRRHLGKFYHRPPGGESWADVALRLRSFLRDALPGPEKRPMIVAHDAVVMLLLSILLPLDEAELLDFTAKNSVENASITHVRAAGAGWQVVEFASVAHLDRAGVPVTEHAGSPDVHPQ